MNSRQSGENMKTNRRSLLTAGALGLTGLLFKNSARALETLDIFPVVDTAQGKVRGMTSGGVSKFKGIRYGADTSGKNRFMPPMPPPKWSGVRDCFEYGQVAPQMPTNRSVAYSGLIHFDIQPGGMGEDCLVMNIWTSTLEKNAKRPVLVHVHGGGFYGGSGNSPGYDGEELARFGNCVVITLNHRLGAFGYMNLTAEGSQFAHSGAAGMMDIVAALRWIRENVAEFGGDPSRVLVFGQSGGGAKTSVLMSMPSAKGLFHSAGIMSGSTLRLGSVEAAQRTTDSLMKTLGIAKGQGKRLQQISFEDLLAAQATLEAGDRAKGEAPRSFAPTIDGDAIPANPWDPAAPAISADIPVIISTVLDERAYRLANYDLDEKGLRAFMAKSVGDKRADEALAMYRQEDPGATPFVLQARFDTDQTFRKSSLTQTELKAKQGGAPVWSYLWQVPTPAFAGRYGTPHGSDVGPSLHDVRGGLNDNSRESVARADQLASAWVSLAATGNPNNPKTPIWPQYTLPTRTTLVFDHITRAENDPRGKFREFWEKATPVAAF
jgi:para-nitrobenzyl esterase